NAMDALNPSLTLERQLTEAVLWHGLGTRQEARRRAVEALGEVGIPEPERRVKMYPFQLSGGMRQRAMIAMATITRPSLVIADEPTTALDVTVQKQILDLLVHLQDEGMALVMITHDLGVARYLAQDGVVLREGEVRERGPRRAGHTGQGVGDPGRTLGGPAGPGPWAGQGIPRGGGSDPRRGRRLLRAPPGRHPRDRRRIGIREVHPRPARAATDRSHRRR